LFCWWPPTTVACNIPLTATKCFIRSLLWWHWCFMIDLRLSTDC
jgi:hypothetical protein